MAKNGDLFDRSGGKRGAAKDTSYTAQHIEVLEGLEPVRKRPASVVLLANGCNNGCPGCPNRDVWLDDATLLVASAVERSAAVLLVACFAALLVARGSRAMAWVLLAAGGWARAAGAARNRPPNAIAPATKAVAHLCRVIGWSPLKLRSRRMYRPALRPVFTENPPHAGQLSPGLPRVRSRGLGYRVPAGGRPSASSRSHSSMSGQCGAQVPKSASLR